MSKTLIADAYGRIITVTLGVATGAGKVDVYVTGGIQLRVAAGTDLAHVLHVFNGIAPAPAAEDPAWRG